MVNTKYRPTLDNLCIQQKLNKEVKWVATILTDILNANNKSMRVTFFSKRWWNEEVAKA